MAAPTDEFRELLVGEGDIDVERLRELARYGIPDEVRGETWKLLLTYTKSHLPVSGPLPPSDDEKVDPESRRLIRGEIRRYHNENDIFSQRDIKELMERILVRFLAHNYDTEYSPALVHLLGPFIAVLPAHAETEIYNCFQILMEKLVDYRQPELTTERVANFMMLFRSSQSELCNYFDEEDLSFNQWLVPWLDHLLSRELPLECVLRLWDTYFSSEINNEFSLHIYVCLAILEECQDDLLELEYAEIRGYLQHLPCFKMDEIISKALNLRDEHFVMIHASSYVSFSALNSRPSPSPIPEDERKQVPSQKESKKYGMTHSVMKQEFKDTNGKILNRTSSLPGVSWSSSLSVPTKR